MSAIAALWRFDSNRAAADDCGRMITALSPYGPDRSDIWHKHDIAIGQCLSVVLPEDHFDRQPIIGNNGEVLVADLRLDNRDELRDALGLAPAAAREMADAAILLVAWERWGEDCVDHLIGDFAFAVWDARQRHLFCARDHLGMRPLFFHRSARFFALSSMPKGLFALADIPRALDEDELVRHLALLPPKGTRSFYRDIERIPPGHCLMVSADGQSLRRYWLPDLHRRVALGSDGVYAEALHAQFDQAVRCRLRAVGPVGTQLSGGLDSGAVTATAARILGETNARLFAFTAVPRDPASIALSHNRFADEGSHAATVAAFYPNIDHVLVRNTGRSPLDALTRTNLHCERPFLNACNLVWLDAIESAAESRGVRALLTGQFGNMTASFDGLPLLPSLLRQGRLWRWLDEARALAAAPGWRWRGVMALSIGPFLPNRIWHLAQRLSSEGALRLADYSALRADHSSRTEIDSEATAFSAPRQDSRVLRMDVLSRFDMGDYLAGAMANHGIDYRDPTADKRLVEFSLALPDEQFLRQGTTRSLMRRTMAGLLPESVLSEWRKGLQAADWYENLCTARDEIAAEIEHLEASPAARDCLDLARMRHLVEDWPDGGWQSQTTVMAYRYALLRGLAAGRFIRYVEGGNA